jgi:hypothetical protein
MAPYEQLMETEPAAKAAFFECQLLKASLQGEVAPGVKSSGRGGETMEGK